MMREQEPPRTDIGGSRSTKTNFIAGTAIKRACIILCLLACAYFLPLMQLQSSTIASPSKTNKDHSRDKELPVLNETDSRDKELLVLNETDIIYTGKIGCWDCSPIVVESQRLLFFSVPKVACTTFKMLFRRMSKVGNWTKSPVHDPNSNGLTYLHHYPIEEANKMMTSPHWTRAIFLRDPQTRVLSAYLEKVGHRSGYYVRNRYCYSTCLKTETKKMLQCSKNETLHISETEALISFGQFLDTVAVECRDPHWKTQRSRIPERLWKYINFVGHFETVEADARRLFDRLADPEAWETYGATGWDFMVRSEGGTKKSTSIFSSATSSNHHTGATDKQTGTLRPNWKPVYAKYIGKTTSLLFSTFQDDKREQNMKDSVFRSVEQELVEKSGQVNRHSGSQKM